MAEVGIKARPVCPQFRRSLQYVSCLHSRLRICCRIHSTALYQGMCFPLARQSKRKGNALSASTSFPGKIPLPSSVRGEKSTLISSWHIMQLQPRSLKVRSPEYILRTRRHTYRPLGPYPCSFTTIDHVRGNSLKATVASLHPALGGRLQILTDERQTEFIRSWSDERGSCWSY